ncbi:hypothetical protein LINGRAHAP2_LOCUS22688 [Linum grandiflorum]
MTIHFANTLICFPIIAYLFALQALLYRVASHLCSPEFRTNCRWLHLLSIRSYLQTQIIWCSMRIVTIPHHPSNVDHTGPSPSYAIVAHCSDATVHAYLLFTGLSANMLLKMHAHEYATLFEDSQIQMLERLTDVPFIVEHASLSRFPVGLRAFQLQTYGTQ